MGTERIIIRRAIAKDAEGMIDVLNSTRLFEEAWAGDEDWTKEALRKALITENLVLLVAEINRRIVGFADYMIFPSLWECKYQGFIIDLFVHKTFQDKGIGGKLIEAVVQRSDAARLGELHVSTGLENARARRLYVRHGFTEEQPMLERSGKCFGEDQR